MTESARPASHSGSPTFAGETSGTPLFGRTEVYDELVRQLRQTVDGSGRMIILTGDVGLGKSTLLRAAIGAAHELHFQVLVGRALPSDVPEPFVLVQSLLRSARLQGAERSAEAPQTPTIPLFLAPAEHHGSAPAATDPESVTESEEASEANRLLSNLLANPKGRAAATRSSLFAQLADFFHQIAASSPLLLALDDLHFADDSSLEFLQLFVSTLDRSRVAIVATSAPPAQAPMASRDAIDQLLASANVEALRIRPMTESELGQYVRWMLHGRDPGRDAVMRWFSQTEGNPLFAEHLVRRSQSASSSAEAAPRASLDFEEVLHDRIQRLGEPEGRVLVYASALGREFDFETLSKASGGDEERLSESVDRLVQFGVLREKGGEVYEFVSERARSDVYGQLTETRRRILHRNIARAIEARGAEDSSTIYELARQFYLGRDDAKAVEYNRRAATLASQAYAYETAIVFLERALECAKRLPSRDPTQELLILVELGRYLDEMGDLRRSEELLVEAVHHARALPGREADLALALLGLAQTRSDMSEYASARDLAQEAYGLLESLGHRRGLLAAHRVLGVTFWRLGDLAEAERHQRLELEIADAEGTSAERGHARVDLANTFIVQGLGRNEEALRLYGEAVEIFGQGSDYGAHARVLMNRSLIHHSMGHMPEALSDITRALEAAERSRSRIWISYCLLNLAQFRAELHEPDEATRLLDRGDKLLEAEGDKLYLQQSTMIRGITSEERGNLPRAEGYFQEALKLAREQGLGAETAEAHFRLAHLAFRRGDRADARVHLARARDAGIDRLHADLMGEVEALERSIEAASPDPHP